MILVTGANGTVGREVARRLAGHGPVRLALRDPSGPRSFATCAARAARLRSAS